MLIIIVIITGGLGGFWQFFERRADEGLFCVCAEEESVDRHLTSTIFGITNEILAVLGSRLTASFIAKENTGNFFVAVHQHR